MEGELVEGVIMDEDDKDVGEDVEGEEIEELEEFVGVVIGLIGGFAYSPLIHLLNTLMMCSFLSGLLISN